MHATPNSVVASTVAIDLAKDVFELAFADANAQIVERRRLNRGAFAKVLDRAGVSVTLRREKGHDIAAACGQLRLKTEKERGEPALA